jgi:hypothetical protein
MTAREDRFRDASAGLAASLAGASGTQGGTVPRPATGNERWLLGALAAAGGAATPAQLIAAHPARFPGAGDPDGQEIRSCTSGLHRTAASLVRKGWAKRGRVQARAAGTGRVQGGRRLYRITESGRGQL